MKEQKVRFGKKLTNPRSVRIMSPYVEEKEIAMIPYLEEETATIMFQFLRRRPND